MLPFHPPFPTAWNLPFRPDVGSQTSILISESLDGASVAPTRQNSGRRLTFGGGCPGRTEPSGMTNCPAATVSVRVMVVSGSASDFKPSQEAPVAGHTDIAVAKRQARAVVSFGIG